MARHVKFYFLHNRTPLLTLGGKGPNLPPMTELIVVVDETQNPTGAAPLRSSYQVSDAFGLAIQICSGSENLSALGENLTYLWWGECDRPTEPTKFAVTQLVHSDFDFNPSRELASKVSVATGMRDPRTH